MKPFSASDAHHHTLHRGDGSFVWITPLEIHWCEQGYNDEVTDTIKPHPIFISSENVVLFLDDWFRRHYTNVEGRWERTKQ